MTKYFPKLASIISSGSPNKYKLENKMVALGGITSSMETQETYWWKNKLIFQKYYIGLSDKMDLLPLQAL